MCKRERTLNEYNGEISIAEEHSGNYPDELRLEMRSKLKSLAKWRQEGTIQSGLAFFSEHIKIYTF